MGISQNPALMRDLRGVIDGREFFSKSPFSSRYFLTATIASLACIAFDIFLICRYRSGVSSTLLVLAFMDVFVLLSWFGAVRHIRRVRAAFSESSLENIDAGSSIDIVLGVAAGAIFDWLAGVSATVLLVLIYIGINLAGSIRLRF